MSKNLSFTVDLEQVKGGGPSSGTLNSEEILASHSQAQAWEINFGEQSAAAKKPSLPKILQDWERNRSSPLKSSPKTSPLKSAPKTKPPRRSASSPLKARDPKPIDKPPSKATTSPPWHSNSATSRLRSTNPSSPKKSPTIKKTLLPVTSPTKTSRATDLKSRSECSLDLMLDTNKKNASKKKKTRPHSASASLELIWQERGQGAHRGDVATSEGVDAQDVVIAKSGGLRQSKADMEMPRPSKSLPVVTLGRMEGSSSDSKLATTPSEMAQRKMLDLKRWYCMCHPQYSMSCGISSVVSCWNYLFSTLGNGSLPPLTQEEALALLGFHPPFGEIKFGPFTGNITCMRWFQRLCAHFGVSGQAYYFYKPVGRRRTVGINPSMALERLQEGLRSDNMAFVYHCSNHYFCPIGYEQVPRKATDAYRVGLRAEEVDTWVLIGEPSRRQSAIHCFKWESVVKDLTCESPKYFNIRHKERGMVVRNTKRKGGNIHCIMALRKVEESLTTLPYRVAVDAGTEDYDGQEVRESEVEELDSSDSDYPEEHICQTHVDIELANSNLSSSCQQEFEQEVASSGVRRSGTFTKERPVVKVREPSTDSEISIDSSGIDLDDGTDNPPDLSTAASLRRSGTFTKDTPTVQRTRAWSSEEDSDASVNTTYSSHEELLEGAPDCSHGRTRLFTVPGNQEVKKSEAFTETSQSNKELPVSTSKHDDSNKEDVTTGNDATSEESPPLELKSNKRRGTFTKDEPSFTMEELVDAEMDLNTTLKASDYVEAEDT